MTAIGENRDNKNMLVMKKKNRKKIEYMTLLPGGGILRPVV